MATTTEMMIVTEEGAAHEANSVDHAAMHSSVDGNNQLNQAQVDSISPRGNRLEYDRGDPENFENSQSPDHQNQIEIQRKMIAKTKTDKSVSIAKKHMYDTVGSNGLFCASPSVVKFAGFKTNKTHTIKLRLINNSPAPQRLHILPPQTKYFKIRCQKKGMIPTGVAEEIYIQFTPAVDEYKYYYDSLRIHCDGDKILIPIHAFPVINSSKDELFPKFIDMGKACQIGQTYMK